MCLWRLFLPHIIEVGAVVTYWAFSALRIPGGANLRREVYNRQ